MRGEEEILREVGTCVGNGVYGRAEGTAHGEGGLHREGSCWEGQQMISEQQQECMKMLPITLDSNLKVK